MMTVSADPARVSRRNDRDIRPERGVRALLINAFIKLRRAKHQTVQMRSACRERARARARRVRSCECALNMLSEICKQDRGSKHERIGPQAQL